MKEWFYRVRFRIAYFICPEYIDDIEERLSGLLFHTTGGLLSKTNYTLNGMISAVDDYQQRCCEDYCEYYRAAHPTEKGGVQE
jgi:hypothetical protein